MMLNDEAIESLCTDDTEMIFPYNRNQLQPASYDLRLGEILDERRNELVSKWELFPGEFLIASTKERVHIPNNIAGQLDGKSTNARDGLIIHTAGFIDPGFEGTLTLEITNLSPFKSIQLYSGMMIAQIHFFQLIAPASRPYGSRALGSHYQKQDGPTRAWHKNM